jgi:mono/diheme cytochrome c family protein
MKSHQRSVIAFAILLCIAGCAVAPRTPPATLIADHPSEDVRAGGKLFEQHCAACHGIDAGGGGRGPSLQTPSVQTMPDAALVRFLTDGDLRKGMPSWSRLPSERRWQLARFLKSLSTAEGPHAK